MASRRCWSCGDTAVMLPQNSGHYPIVPQGTSESVQASFYKCPGCAAPSVGLNALSSHTSSGFEKARQDDQLSWLPAKPFGKQFPDVPEHIASAAHEAYGCASVGSYRAAAVLARAVVEATCKHRIEGKSGDKLHKRINDLRDAGHIRQHTADAAHEIRYLGNDMAHGDFVIEVDKEDAEAALELMSDMLDEVYQGPARVERARTRRVGSSQGEE